MSESQTLQLWTPSAGLEVGAAVTGATVSRYVVLDELGRGGMGRVLRAYDPKLQREVALKEVRPDALGAEATERLVAEARAMAKLSDPNVVAVYDVEELARPEGDDPGREVQGGVEVVLVMEYVPGQTLRDWLRAGEHPWRTIVDRFVEAGRGLAAAHAVGLLHRDFKPANVLVGDSGVKVTDFGLAKASSSLETESEGLSLDGELSEVMTVEGLVLGTPRYMAPEQHRGEALTPAADQYAFCVALFEALSGAPPFSGPSMAMDKEDGPPTWTHAAVPRPIVHAVMRGLAPGVDDRWPSMLALLEALQWDPARSRRRIGTIVGVAGIVAIGGSSFGLWANGRAERCSGAQEQLAGVWDDEQRADVQRAFEAVGKAYAERAGLRTLDALDDYAAAWVAMHTEACEATTVRGEQSAHMLDLRMGCLRSASVRLGTTVAVLADADEGVVRRADALTTGLPSLSRCADTDALAADVEPPEPSEAEAVQLARLHLAEATTLLQAGRYDPAVLAIEAAKEALQGVVYGPVHTELALDEGTLLERRGKYEDAERRLTDALQGAAQWHQWEVMRRAAFGLMFVVGTQQQRPDDAMRYRALAEGLSQGDPDAEAGFHDYLANLLEAQGKYPEAEAECRRALAAEEASRGPDHAEVARARNSLAGALDNQGKHAEAEREYRAATRIWEATLGPEHPNCAAAHHNLGVCLYYQGKYAEAERELRVALARWEAAVGPEHSDNAHAHNNLGNVLARQGKHLEAEVEYRAARALWEAALGPDHPYVAGTRANVAGELNAQGKHAEAEAEYRAALAVREAAFGPDHPDVAHSRFNLGECLFAQGKYAEAEVEYRASLSVREATLGPDHPRVAMGRDSLAVLLLATDRIAEALPLAEQAWTRRQRDDIPPEQQGDAAFVLAQILWDIVGPARDRPRAHQLADLALQAYRSAEGARDGEVDAVQGWLEGHPAP